MYMEIVRSSPDVGTKNVAGATRFIGNLGRMQKENILVIIPCYNEEAAIGSIVLRSLTHAGKVLVVDDGSTDKTAEVAWLAGAEVISHKTNLGKGASIRDALNHVRTIGAQVIILIDGDGQHNPDEIPNLVKPIISGEADIVNGSRFAPDNVCHVPMYRRIGQSVLTLATNFCMRQKIGDTQSGFRALSAKTLDCFSLCQNGMAVESEMLIDAASASLRIVEVPITVRYDVNGSTHNPIKHGFSVLGSVALQMSQRRPILLFGLPGIFSLLVGCAFILLFLDAFRPTGTILNYYAIIGLLCIILGGAVVSTALTLNSIRRAGAN
jgi:hypothetical protein